ncbi:hypothetical protein F2Q69_00023501 [Brassica cretica]|uniref:CCHC-type domain-containing protein n=1 Tax=Brassica cretica TaxID=69181 RepID=A0A8S9QKY5_BRACR|nr:hypothetical protein F2Q69_00023501 [Brassica cretica]
MEDYDDDFDQPPIALGAEDCGGQTFPKGRAKTINKDNRGLEDDVDFVRQSISEVNESEGGDVDVVLVNPPKQNPQTQPGYNDDDFFDPPVTQAGQFQGGEEFMKGIQVSEMSSKLHINQVDTVALFTWKNELADYHVKKTWAETIKGIILPVPDPKDVDVPPEVLKVELYPPTTKRSKGRPGVKRKLSAGEFPEGPKKKKANKCFRCYMEGHKKTTCKQLMP